MRVDVVMSQESPLPPHAPNLGASGLEVFADYVKTDPVKDALSKEAEPNSQYVVVHMYLVPGDANDVRRQVLRNCIVAELAELHAIRLHTDAFAVPCVRTDEGPTARMAWHKLLFAGSRAAANNRSSAWMTGDVVYLHYAGDNGMHATASRPGESQPLPIPEV